MRNVTRVQHAVVGLAILACLGWSGVAEAQTPRTWNVTSGVWQTGANWLGGAAPANDTTTNSAVFGGAANESSSLNAAASIAGLTFSGAGTKTISSDSTTARVLTLGASGITVNATSGAVTLGNATNTLNLEISADQTWTNNSANLLTVLGTVRPNVATAGTYTLTVTGSGNTTLSGALNDNGSRILALTKTGTGALTLGGANTLTGAATISNGGLVLDYSAQDNSKLGDSAVLTLGSATTRASVTISGGSHTEVVGSTTLGGGYTTIARSGGSSRLRLNAITRSNRATIDFGAASLADTDTLNDATGILGPWATVGGTDWATNSTNAADGAITAYAGYTDIDATGSTLADGSSTNVRLNAAGPGGNVQLGATTTAVNTLLQNATTAATVNMAGGTLRTSGIMVGSAGQSLTLGRAPGSGTLTAATAGGELMLINNSANPLRINALVADNTSASSLTKSGTGRVLVTGGASYTGPTAVNAGTLEMRVLAGTTTLSGAISGPGGLVKSGGGALTLSGANSSFSGPLTLAAGTLNWSAANNLGTGQINVTGNATLTLTANANISLPNSGIVLSDAAAFRFRTSANQGGAVGAVPPTTTGGSVLNPVRFFMDGYNNSPTLSVGNIRVTGNVTAFGSPNFWYSGGDTVTLGHASNVFFDMGSQVQVPNTYNNDYVGSGWFNPGTANRRVFGSGAFASGIFNHSSLASFSSQSQSSRQGTFNILPVAFSVAPNQSTSSNIANVALAGGLKGTAGARATSGHDTPTSVTVSSAAGDVYMSQGLSYSAATATYGTVGINGPGRLTLQTDSGLGVGRLTLGSSAFFTTTANITTTGTITVNAGSTLRLAGAAGRLSAGSHAGAIVNSGTLVYASGSNQTLSGIVSGAGAVAVRGDSLATTGTLTLSGANTFSGATTVSSGGLVLNYATQDNGKLADGAAFTLGNAAVSLAGGSHAETVGSTTLLAGFSSIARSGGSATLNLNSITRSVGGGLDFGAASIATTDLLNTNGILGGWATVAGTDWAVNSTNAADGSITALASYTSDTWSSGNNTTVTTNGNVADAVTNSLRFNAAAGTTLTLSGTGTLESGGILVTANVGANAATITGGALRGSSGGELFVTQNNTASDLTIASQIVDNGAATALTKAGSGRLVVSGNNSYTGGTFLDAGTLAFANGGLGSTGSVRFAGSSTLQWASGNTQDISSRLAIDDGVIATLDTNGNNVTLSGSFGGGGAGGLTKVGSGRLILSGSNSFTGPTTVSAGVLELGSANGLAGSTLTSPAAGLFSFGSLTSARLGGLTGTNNLVLENASGSGVALAIGANNSPTLTYSGVLSGAGSFEKTGYGRLILTGANRYAGSTTITNGYVTLSGGVNRLPNATNLSFANEAGAILNLNGQMQVIGSLTGGGTAGGHVWVNNGTLFVGNATSGTYSGYFIDNGTIVKQGAGTLTLSGESTFGGTLRVDAGTVRMQAHNGLGLFYNPVIGDAGTLDLNGFSAMVGSLLGSGTVAMKDGTGALTVRSTARTTYAGRVTGFGALIKENSGWLTLTNANNDYSGGTQLAGGRLEFASGALGSTGQITVTTDPYLGGASVLRWLAGNTQDISSRLVIVPGVTATLDTNGNDVTFATGIGNNGFGSLTKMGLGTLSLAAANTFTGLTSVNAGTLRLDFAAAGAPASDILADESALAFGGGTLLVRGNASGSVSQSLANVTLNAGGGSLLVNPNGGTSTTVNLGTIAGTAAGSALLVGTQSGAGAGTATVTTLTGTDTQGIYGGRVVFTDGSANGFNWATATAASGVSTLGAFSGYSALATTAGTDTANSRITANTTLTGGVTTNTLKIEDPAASQSLSIGAGNTLTLTAGGLLATGTNAFTISAGTLTAGNGSGSFDLVVQQYNAGGLTISSVIGNNSTNATSLTKAGSGNLTLSGANTFTGGVFLNSGTLTINNATALGTSASRLTIQPGTTIDNTSGAAASSLTLTSNNPQTWNGDFTYLGTGGRSLNMGTGAITLGNDVNLAVNGGTLTVGAIGGSGFGLTKSGAGTLAVGGNVMSFSGPFTVAAGSVTGNGTSLPNTDIVMANVAGAQITLQNNAATILSLAGGGSTGGNFTIASDLTIAGNASTTYGGLLSGGGAAFFFTKNGVGTLTLTNASNSFNNIIRVNNGTLAFSAVGALGTATSAIELNQASGVNSGGIAYTGNVNTTLSRGITVTNGLGSVSNLGSGTLTLSGTLTKNGTILRLAGGAFSVSGRITGANANSDLYVDGANVTLSNTNNDYNGPTFVYGGGTLALGTNGVIPDGSPVLLGDSTTRGTLNLGTFTDTISQLAFSGSGGTVRMAANQTASPQLNSTSSLTLGSNASLDLSGMQTTAGNYRLISASSLSGTFGSVSGLDSNYLLRYGTVNANEISAQRKANQATSFTMTTPARALVNTNVAVSGTLINSSTFTGGSSLAINLASTGLSGSGFSTGSIGVSGTTAVSGLLNAGSTVGTQNWSITNTDSDAITTTGTATGSLTVVNQRTFSSPATINLGRVLIGASPVNSGTVTSTALSGTTANSTLQSYSGSAINGLSLSGGNVLFNGVTTAAAYSLTGSVSGTAGNAIGGTFNLNAQDEFGNTITNAANVAYTGTAIDQRTFSSGTITLGNFLRGTSMSGSTSVTSLGTYATTASGTLGNFTGGPSGFSLTTNDSTAFNGADSQTANYTLSGSAAAAGVINGSFTSSVSAELGTISPVSVALVGTAYDAASISKVQTGNVGNGGAISITNAAGDYRSAAFVASTSLTGQGWSVTGFGTNSFAAAGGSLIGTANFNGAGLLSGTYAGTFSATFQNDQSYKGAGVGDLGSQSWSLYQVYVNTSGSGSTVLAANTALSTVSLVSGTGANATIASFAAGTTGLSAADVAMSFTSSSASGQFSDILKLEGTNGLDQVLQITYDPTRLGTTSAESLVLGWLDTRIGSTTNGQWINSVLGNTGTNLVTMTSPFLGSWAAYLAAGEGRTLANSLGAYGVDTSTKTVWAAINHNSQFVVIVPEPGALALAGIGIAAAAYAARRRKS